MARSFPVSLQKKKETNPERWDDLVKLLRSVPLVTLRDVISCYATLL